MRIPAFTMAAAMLGVAGAVQAQPGQADTQAIIPGVCQSVVVSGRGAACMPSPRVLYVSLAGGGITYHIGLADGRILSFIGDIEEQRTLNEYWLHLALVRVGTHARYQSAEAEGTCRINLTTTGTVVNRILCDATDVGGNRFVLDFRGTGERVVFSRSR
ncbi:hypothetical protein GCM10010964_21660 [Caldovatus sediminis]|uniref:Uncharacterized protein n=1 Tax=Caldovatus sediminis TaxID=2041189 RepID=A0A8J3EB46_9PROT|nr:hypothetical protein [Caldovatus sediminis]GGG33437.1 hypothetical protein GCM10010964_21660 [Caldovatus sediminis]